LQQEPLATKEVSSPRFGKGKSQTELDEQRTKGLPDQSQLTAIMPEGQARLGWHLKSLIGFGAIRITPRK
jgi:hypothetical protein